jgi:hypothetical protein
MSGNKSVCAFVREGALVVNFGSALQPFIWRYDISKAHVLGFRVVHNDQHWQLGVEGGKGDFTPVATFAREAQAQNALRLILQALKRQGSDRRVLMRTAVFAVVFFSLIVTVMFALSTLRAIAINTRAVPQLSQAQTIQSGKVLSADEALKLPAGP